MINQQVTNIKTLLDEFTSVINDLNVNSSEYTNDSRFNKFIIEFNNMLSYYSKKKKNEKLLENRKEDLKNHLMSTEKKLKTLMEINVKDQSTIFELKKEHERAWKIVGDLDMKDNESRHVIKDMTEELEHLTKLIDEGCGFYEKKQKMNFIKVLNEKEESEEMNGKLTKENESLIRKLKEMKDIEKDLINRKKELFKDRKILGERILRNNNIIKQEKQINDKAGITLCCKIKVLERKNKLHQQKESEKDEVNDENEKTAIDIENQVQNLRFLKQNYVKVRFQIEKLRTRINEKSNFNSLLHLDNEKESNRIKEINKDLTGLNNKIHRLNDFKEKELYKIERVHNKIEDTKNEIDRIKRKIYDNEKEDQFLVNKINDLKFNDLENYQYQKNIKTRDIINELRDIQNYQTLQAEVEKNKNKVNCCYSKRRDVIEKQKFLIADLKRKRSKQSQKTILLHKRYKDVVEGNNIKVIENKEILKQLNETTDQYKRKRESFEILQGEKNDEIYKYESCDEEISELKKKHSLLTKQVHSLRSDISKLEKLKYDGTIKLNKLFKEIEQSKKAKDLKTDALKKLESAILDKRVTLDKMNDAFKRDGRIKKDNIKSKNELNNAVDFLSSLLVKRNDELALLYSQMSIQNKCLQDGKLQLLLKENDLRMLKIAVVQLTKTLQNYSKDVKVLETQQKLILESEDELLRVRLSKECFLQILEDTTLENRCRIIDPVINCDYKTLAKKISRTQVKIIRKIEDLMEIDNEIKKKEQLMIELQELKKSQPDLDEFRRSTELEQRISTKIYEMKSLASEINCYNFLQKEKKLEFERLKKINKEGTKRLLLLNQKRKLCEENGQSLKDNQKRQSNPNVYNQQKNFHKIIEKMMNMK